MLHLNKPTKTAKRNENLRKNEKNVFGLSQYFYLISSFNKISQKREKIVIYFIVKNS